MGKECTERMQYFPGQLDGETPGYIACSGMKTDSSTSLCSSRNAPIARESEKTKREWGFVVSGNIENHQFFYNMIRDRADTRLYFRPSVHPDSFPEILCGDPQGIGIDPLMEFHTAPVKGYLPEFKVLPGTPDIVRGIPDVAAIFRIEPYNPMFFLRLR
jgi:hypothetical protein